MIKKVIACYMASHLEVAEKLNEIIDVVNSLSGDAPASQSEQTKLALEKIEQTLGNLQQAVGSLSEAKNGKKTKK